MRILRRIFVPTLITIMLVSISYAAILADSVYKKYTETLGWENSSLQDRIHMVPPGLAQNYVTGEEERLFEIVADINSALEEIKTNQGVPDDKYDQYVALQKTINEEIAANEEIKEFLADNGLNDFNFYIEADSIVKNSYETFNVEDLEKLESTFASRVMKNEQAIDKALLEKIQIIAKDFKRLESFSKKALEKLGAVENGVLNVDLSVNAEITDELLQQIEEKDLKKFPHIEKLYSLLISESWSNIIAHNEDSKKYFAWQESKAILENLAKSSYIPVSSLKTVEDVLHYYPKVKHKEKANHTINKESLVENVYFDGKILDENLYVRKDADLTFDIKYEYTENPKSTITVKYSDNFGNQLKTETYEDYVGNSITILTELPGYVLKESVNIVKEFGVEDATVILVYEKYVPPVIEEPPVIEPPIEGEQEETPEDNLENEE